MELICPTLTLGNKMSKLVQNFTIGDKIVTDTGNHILNCRVFEYVYNDDHDMEIHLYLINNKNEVAQILEFSSKGGAECSSSLNYNLGQKLI